MTKRNIAKRLRLFELQSGKCFFCGCQMAMRPRGRKSPTLQDDECTLDHLDDRYCLERGLRPYQRRIVASCHACNRHRSQVAEAQVPLAELHARSRRSAAIVGPTVGLSKT